MAKEFGYEDVRDGPNENYATLQLYCHVLGKKK